MNLYYKYYIYIYTQDEVIYNENMNYVKTQNQIREKKINKDI